MYIVTGNSHKLKEYQSYFPSIESKKLDLPEIQSLDEVEIQEFKISEAKKFLDSNFVVDDVSFYLDCLPGLPGTFIKWFNQTIKPQGLYNLALQSNNLKAMAKCIISYVDREGQIHHFRSAVKGKIVSPVSQDGFGFDVVFVPDGFQKTYSEMSSQEKNTCSHRGIAMQKLAQALTSI